MFDLNSPKDLFFYIKDSMQKYLANDEKKISDIFFLIMALNHLREWIAPDYNPTRNKTTEELEWKDPKNKAEIFSKNIYSQENFSKLRKICNGTKHLSKSSPPTSFSYDLPIDSWDNVDSVKDFDKGPPSGFFVGRDSLETILISVIDYYDNQWFNKKA